jgi:tRNA/rRNA methyltransferase
MVCMLEPPSKPKTSMVQVQLIIGQLTTEVQDWVPQVPPASTAVVPPEQATKAVASRPKRTVWSFMASSGQVSLILHRPRSLDNVGAVARIVKNFGLGRLWLVDPLSHSFDRALKLAVGAEDVVSGLFVEQGLPRALGAFSLVIGTSSRQLKGRASLSPRQMAERAAACPGSVALLCGEEKRGLSDEELALCHEVCRIPSSEAQPSLNLAQACAVLAYEIVIAAQPARVPDAPAATFEELAALRERLRTVLDGAQFLNLQNPDRILDELSRPLARAQLSPRELELWTNALRKIAGGLKRGQ